MTDTHDLGRIAILVPGKLSDHAGKRIDRTFDMVRMDSTDPAKITPDLAAKVRGIAAFGGISAAFMDALPNLEIVASFGVGYDSVDAAHAGKKSVMVTNTPDVLTEEVADTALGLLINAVRELPRAENYLREGRWVKEGPYRLTSGTLRGRKAGIFGMGRIGQAIARRLEAFGLSVAYHNRRKVEGPPDAGVAGRRRRYADISGSGRRIDAEGGQCRGAEGARAERRLRQHRPRQHGR